MLIPQNTGLIQELSSGPERGRAFGILGATVGLATAAGPVIDGLILATVPGADNWRWVFYVNVPIGFVALMFAGSPRTGQGRYAPARPSGTCPVRYCSAVACSACSFRWSTRATAKLASCDHAHLAGVRTAPPGRTPLHASSFRIGRHAVRLGLAISAVIAGRLVSRFWRWITVCGLTVTIVGMVVTALVLWHASGDAAAWTAAGPLLVAGLGGGMATSPTDPLPSSGRHRPRVLGRGLGRFACCFRRHGPGIAARAG